MDKHMVGDQFLYKHMSKRFQDYLLHVIQDFEADFVWKVSLKVLNLAHYNSISHLF